MSIHHRHLDTLDAPPRSLRQAVGSLIADKENESAILDRIEALLRQRASIIYQPTPEGLQEGQPERYREIIDACTSAQAAAQAALAILGPSRFLDERNPFLHLMDRSGMLRRLGCWPDHIRTMRDEARQVAEQFRSLHPGAAVRKVKILGLGGSAAPHAIAAEIISNGRKSAAEIEVVHADSPNADFFDPETLAIFASFSGNTEETIHCYELLRDKTPLRVVLTKGGKLGRIAEAEGVPFIHIPSREDHPAFVEQPRESACIQLTALLTLLACLELRPGSGGQLTLEDLGLEHEVIPMLGAARRRFGPDVPFMDNPAKKLAFFLLYGRVPGADSALNVDCLWDKRIPFILVDRNNSAVGHEVRTQMHERAKVNCGFYEAPEFLHNLVESIRSGVESAQAGLDDDRFVYYLIRSADEQRRITLRLDRTIDLVMSGKCRYAIFWSEGANPFQRALFSTYFHAHMTTYLAVLNGYDPLPVPTMSYLKEVMDGFRRGGAEEKAACAAPRQLLSLQVPH